jgi:hypothetical protein
MDQVVAQALTLYAKLCKMNRAEATNLVWEPRITMVTFSGTRRRKRSRGLTTARRRSLLSVP